MTAPVSTILAGSDVIRRSADYHPSIWGDHFLSYNSNPPLLVSDEILRHEKLKQEVRRMLTGCPTVPETLEMIDVIQRLGIEYHFESEIADILKNIMDKTLLFEDNDLYHISLEFRLLRQQGFNISCDVFNKFKDKNGKFKDSIVNDARGILSLYEATHLRTHGEESLDEALAFTVAHLGTMVEQVSADPLSDQIRHALKQSFHKGLPRLEARTFFRFYQGNGSCNQILLSFAKLDFNMLQKQHQKELAEITRWWKELDFANKLSFARDRVVECYFWILGVYFEPEYDVARKILTKVITITSVIDDIYDVFATPLELELFTAAIHRWDLKVMDELPKYMQRVYKALIDIYSEIEQRALNQQKSYAFYYAKEAMKKQVRAYFVESKWFHEKHIPKMEEYMFVALVSSGYSLLATTSIVCMDDIATINTFEWLLSDPKIVKASSIIARLMDDIVSHKAEQKRGDVASSIECYMKEYSCREEEAVEEFKERVINAWKDINGEFIHLTSIPRKLKLRILNLARVMDVLYKNEDCYTNAGGVLKDFVSSLLVHPVPMSFST